MHPVRGVLDLHPAKTQVQTSNDAALDFYKKAGFENVGKIDNYYRRIEPPDCFVLAKTVSGTEKPADILGDLTPVKGH